MRIFTSAEANKELKRLNEERLAILQNEKQSSVFTAATTESIEDARPEYNFEGTQGALDEIDRKICILKHAINLFNVSHKPEGIDMTVDQILIYIPQLTASKRKYESMANRLEKTRKESFGRNTLIEYEYANYDLKQAKRLYEVASKRLAEVQLALDRLNNTVTFEVDI